MRWRVNSTNSSQRHIPENTPIGPPRFSRREARHDVRIAEGKPGALCIFKLFDEESIRTVLTEHQFVSAVKFVIHTLIRIAGFLFALGLCLREGNQERDINNINGSVKLIKNMHGCSRELLKCSRSPVVGNTHMFGGV